MLQNQQESENSPNPPINPGSSAQESIGEHTSRRTEKDLMLLFGGIAAWAWSVEQFLAKNIENLDTKRTVTKGTSVIFGLSWLALASLWVRRMARHCVQQTGQLDQQDRSQDALESENPNIEISEADSSVMPEVLGQYIVPAADPEIAGQEGPDLDVSAIQTAYPFQPVVAVISAPEAMQALMETGVLRQEPIATNETDSENLQRQERSRQERVGQGQRQVA